MAAVAATRSSTPSASRVASTQQRERDQDAQAILRAELARTLAAQQAMQRPGEAAQTAVQTAAINRLREDESALRRELSRFNP